MLCRIGMFPRHGGPSRPWAFSSEFHCATRCAGRARGTPAVHLRTEPILHSTHATTPTHIQIGDRRIGPNEPCYVIAEAGINHNGDLAIAKQLVDAAAAAGADAVKFQKRKLAEVYQEKILAEPRLGEQALQYLVPILVEFELSDQDFTELQRYSRTRGITFLCTPWDTHSVDFLE